MAPSTDYAAKNRVPSTRADSDADLTLELVTPWEADHRVYGVPELWKTVRRRYRYRPRPDGQIDAIRRH